MSEYENLLVIGRNAEKVSIDCLVSYPLRRACSRISFEAALRILCMEAVGL